MLQLRSQGRDRFPCNLTLASGLLYNNAIRTAESSGRGM